MAGKQLFLTYQQWKETIFTSDASLYYWQAASLNILNSVYLIVLFSQKWYCMLFKKHQNVQAANKRNSKHILFICLLNKWKREITQKYDGDTCRMAKFSSGFSKCIAVHIFFCPRDDSQGALGFAPVCPSVCPSVRHALRYRVCVINSSHSFYTPAYEVCRGVYSFRLSVRSSVLPWFRPSVRASAHTSVNILRQSFAWSFCAFLYLWKLTL